MANFYAIYPGSSSGGGGGGQTFDTGAGATTANTLRTVIVTDQTSIPVTFTPGATDFGASAAAERVAALLGNPTGLASFGAGATSAQTLRTVLVTDQTAIPVTLGGTALDFGASAAALRVAALLGNSTGQASFGAGATTAQTLRTVLVTDQTSIPVALSGSALDFGTSAAALRTAAQLGNATGAAAFDTGASTAQTLRTVLSTRQETATTPLATRLSDGAAFYQAPTTAQLPAALGSMTMANSLPVVIASDQTTVSVNQAFTFWSYSDVGQNGFGSITNAYVPVVTTTAPVRIVYIFNSLDQPVNVSLDGIQDSFIMEQGDSISIDFGANRLLLATGSPISVKCPGTLPVSGKIRVAVEG